MRPQDDAASFDAESPLRAMSSSGDRARLCRSSCRARGVLARGVLRLDGMQEPLSTRDATCAKVVGEVIDWRVMETHRAQRTAA